MPRFLLAQALLLLSDHDRIAACAAFALGHASRILAALARKASGAAV